jgi:aspartate carbamoyltransferase catalytic subunit
MPHGIESFGAEPFTDFDAALNGADVVMMLRLQNERMQGDFIPSPHSVIPSSPSSLILCWNETREES